MATYFKHDKKKKALGVMFGGKSAEHEISVISALQAIEALDSSLYDIIPIYLAPTSKWYTGKALLNKKIYAHFATFKDQLEEVTLLPHEEDKGLRTIPRGFFSKSRVIKLDACLMAFHGQQGENGCVQGLLELAGIPYTGCGVMAASVAMDKYVSKMFLQAHGLPVLPCQLVHRLEAMADIEGVCQKILSTPGLEQFPLFVKPCHLGSSIGISKAEDKHSLQSAIAKAMRYDDKVIVEPCVTDLMEINVSVLEPFHAPMVSAVEVPVSEKQILTYEDKYLRGGGKKGGSGRSGMAALTRIIDPLDLDPQIKELVQEYAKMIFSLLGCAGVSRLDFIYDLKNHRVYFNEINPIPGSLSFYLWEKSTPRILYTDMLTYLIESAIRRKDEQLALECQLEFRALK